MEQEQIQTNIGDEFCATEITPIEFTDLSDDENGLTWLAPWMKLEIVSTVKHEILGVLAKVMAYDPNDTKANLRLNNQYVPLAELAKLSKASETDQEATAAAAV